MTKNSDKARKILECLNNNTVDLVVMLDGSGSVGDDTFQLQKNFVAHLARRLNVSSTNSHMAVVQYAETPQLEISLNQYTNNFQVFNSFLIFYSFNFQKF